MQKENKKITNYNSEKLVIISYITQANSKTQIFINPMINYKYVEVTLIIHVEVSLDILNKFFIKKKDKIQEYLFDYYNYSTKPDIINNPFKQFETWILKESTWQYNINQQINYIKHTVRKNIIVFIIPLYTGYTSSTNTKWLSVLNIHGPYTTNSHK